MDLPQPRAPPAVSVASARRPARRACGRGLKGNPCLSNHNSGPIAMHPVHVSHATKGRQIGPVKSRIFDPFSATMPGFTNP